MLAGEVVDGESHYACVSRARGCDDAGSGAGVDPGRVKGKKIMSEGKGKPG